MPRPKGARTEEYDFTDQERSHLTAVVNRLDTPWILRPTFEEDPQEYIRLHRQAGCRVEHRGTILVHGEGFQPSKIRAERER